MADKTWQFPSGIDMESSIAIVLVDRLWMTRVKAKKRKEEAGRREEKNKVEQGNQDQTTQTTQEQHQSH